jgi:hypothetical protein
VNNYIGKDRTRPFKDVVMSSPEQYNVQYAVVGSVKAINVPELFAESQKRAPGVIE